MIQLNRKNARSGVELGAAGVGGTFSAKDLEV